MRMIRSTSMNRQTESDSLRGFTMPVLAFCTIRGQESTASAEDEKPIRVAHSDVFRVISRHRTVPSETLAPPELAMRHERLEVGCNQLRVTETSCERLLRHLTLILK